MRTLLRGGQILDGAGAPAYRGDVRLNGDKIEAVGALSPLPDEQVIDVSGCVVCPAFVDMHRHMDARPLLGDDMAVEPSATAASRSRHTAALSRLKSAKTTRRYWDAIPNRSASSFPNT